MQPHNSVWLTNRSLRQGVYIPTGIDPSCGLANPHRGGTLATASAIFYCIWPCLGLPHISRLSHHRHWTSPLRAYSQPPTVCLEVRPIEHHRQSLFNRRRKSTTPLIHCLPSQPSYLPHRQGRSAPTSTSEEEHPVSASTCHARSSRSSI